MALGQRGDNWQWGRWGPKDPKPGNPDLSPMGTADPLLQSQARPSVGPRGIRKLGPLPFPEFRLVERLQVFANHLQPNNSEHLLKV